jgi:hypothetical protein
MTSSSSAAPLLTLPPELLLKIFDYLPVVDIISLSSTSKLFRAHAISDHVFAPLCAQHGVRSVSAFPHPYRSFYVVYTRMLHAFGPLLGMYASDAPYRGSVLSVRFEPEEDAESWALGLAGPHIVGEVWTFPHNTALQEIISGAAVDPWDIGMPVPQPVLRIGFPPSETPTSSSDNLTEPIVSTSTPDLPYAHAVCCGKGMDVAHPAILAVSPPRVPRRKIILRVRGEAAPLLQPEFPPSNAPWLPSPWIVNSVRPLTADVFPSGVTRKSIYERLALHAQGVYYDEVAAHQAAETGNPGDDADEALAQLVGEGFVNAAAAPNDDDPGRRFLSIHCACFSPDVPDLALLGPRRLYPLAASAWSNPPAPSTQIWTPRARDEENSPGYVFAPEALAGLWLGDYGPHGTEAIHVSVSPGAQPDERPTLHARKITGDFHVPRGVETWQADLDAEIGGSELVPSVRRALRLDDPSATCVRVFSGWATISDAGFV